MATAAQVPLPDATLSPQHTQSQTHHDVAHPLCPLSPAEIRAASSAIKTLWPSNADLRFKVVTLNEPAKKELLPYLDAEHANTNKDAALSLPRIERRVFVAYYIRNTVCNSPPPAC
jgi:Cu2+-containing amine oxidase